jgi:hypothetical protein
MKDVRDVDVATEKAYETWLEKTGGFARDMTLRDHFAGLATQKLMGTADIDACCQTAYIWADAMLKERAK